MLGCTTSGKRCGTIGGIGELTTTDQDPGSSSELESCPEQNEQIVLLYTPVTHCNLACKYCVGAPAATIRIQSLKAPENDLLQLRPNGYLESFYALAQIMRNALKTNERLRITFQLHGNEPLTIGVDALKKISIALTKLRGDFPGRFIFGTQTNGTLISDEIAKIFKKYKWLVGVSWDGWKAAHDANRIFPNGLGSYEQTYRGVMLLKEEGVPFGVISVITRAHMLDNPIHGAYKYYKWLLENEISSALLHPVSLPSTQLWRKMVPTIGEYIAFFRGIYNLWKKSDDHIDLGPFTDIIQMLIKGSVPPGLCTWHETHCGNVLAIDSSGRVYTCDRRTYYVESSLFDKMQGNTKENLLLQILSRARAIAEQRSYFLRSHDILCATCRFWDICHGGCTHEGVMGALETLEKEKRSLSRLDFHRTKYCALYRVLFRQISQDLAKIGISTRI